LRSSYAISKFPTNFQDAWKSHTKEEKLTYSKATRLPQYTILPLDTPNHTANSTHTAQPSRWSRTCMLQWPLSPTPRPDLFLSCSPTNEDYTRNQDNSQNHAKLNDHQTNTPREAVSRYSFQASHQSSARKQNFYPQAGRKRYKKRYLCQ